MPDFLSMPAMHCIAGFFLCAVSALDLRLEDRS